MGNHREGIGGGGGVEGEKMRHNGLTVWSRVQAPDTGTIPYNLHHIRSPTPNVITTILISTP
jgi:hypothetical protein